MAHVVVELGIFPSVTQARKNGWNDPITLGIHHLTKKKIAVEIVDTPLAKEAKPEIIDTKGLFVDWIDEANHPEKISNVNWAMQFPLDKRFINRLINAHLKDRGIIK